MAGAVDSVAGVVGGEDSTTDHPAAASVEAEGGAGSETVDTIATGAEEASEVVRPEDLTPETTGGPHPTDR